MEPLTGSTPSPAATANAGKKACPTRRRPFVSRAAGHTWPGSRVPLFTASSFSPLSPLILRLILGRTSTKIDATTEIWHATGTSGLDKDSCDK